VNANWKVQQDPNGYSSAWLRTPVKTLYVEEWSVSATGNRFKSSKPDSQEGSNVRIWVIEGYPDTFPAMGMAQAFAEVVLARDCRNTIEELQRA
jgi:hypothetical protein